MWANQRKILSQFVTLFLRWVVEMKIIEERLSKTGDRAFRGLICRTRFINWKMFGLQVTTHRNNYKNSTIFKNYCCPILSSPCPLPSPCSHPWLCRQYITFRWVEPFHLSSQYLGKKDKNLHCWFIR